MSEPPQVRTPSGNARTLPPPDEPKKGEGGSGGRDAKRELAYFAVGGYYDHQKLRTAHMNRIRDIVRKANEGIPFDKVEEKNEKKKFDKRYRDENLPKLLGEIEAVGKLEPSEIAHIQKLLSIAKAEEGLEGQYRMVIQPWVLSHPVYQEFLSTIKGLKGPILSGGLLAWFDVRRAPHPSSFWKFAGLHVIDGKAPKRKHGEKTDYNPKVRTLVWKVADSFIKQRTQPYRFIYDSAKKEEQAKLKDSGKGWKLHAELRAKRKMVKRFLVDFWAAWAKIEGLPPSEPYAIGILGHDRT
jgi:hypothetical protein